VTVRSYKIDGRWVAVWTPPESRPGDAVSVVDLTGNELFVVERDYASPGPTKRVQLSHDVIQKAAQAHCDAMGEGWVILRREKLGSKLTRLVAGRPVAAAAPEAPDVLMAILQIARSSEAIKRPHDALKRIAVLAGGLAP
jgi:hypothetical protein